MSDLPHTTQILGTRPALVLVDLSIGFTDPTSPLGSECDEIVAVNARLLSAFRSGGLPIFFTTVSYDDDQQAHVFRHRLPALNALTPGSRWVEIDPRLEPASDEPIIEKRYASGFFGTSLASQLDDVGANSVVVTGLTTSGCVRATAVDALQHDYPTFVVSDAVSDRNMDAHTANLHDLHAKYAEVLNADTLLTMLPSRVMT
ncbi:MAG: isochorismatase family protein [Halioglobus sp.]